ETAQQVLEMLGAVVDTGTGKAAVIAGYDVAGKTGTAWQPCEHGGYSDCGGGHPVQGRHYTASFVGIVSNELGAAFTVLVIIDNPRGDEFGGGDVAAPVFAEIASYTARQLRVTPIAEPQVNTGPVRAPVSTLPVDDADVPTEDQ
ncbi:MAG: penicillin-binding transpeptidase domain-containing protein, partial [Acidimicrobiales bacterium]|nr:penicillin-binding transpeptidase domain-containing protein [Acidimicrobiales bacterium]